SGKRGRSPRLQNKNNVLACLLRFYTAAVEGKTLCELFGVPPATLSRVLKNAELALQGALGEVPAARIRWPSLSSQRSWAASVKRKEPLVCGCFCVADGKNYPVRAPTTSDLQNAYFSGTYIIAGSILISLTGFLLHRLVACCESYWCIMLRI
ncbi:hypothetical protein JG687_00011846, partial [Phytophthora cactorum]